MDTNQWPQGIGLVKPLEVSKSTAAVLERKPRPQKEQALNCPRCNSINTKFCYYNNYSLSQPRYFCKTCRRYWTEGGTLRNVPVGGGSRKNKRSTSSSSPAVASLKKVPDLTPPTFSQPTSQNPKIHEGQDLNLAHPPTATGGYSTGGSISGLLHFPFSDSKGLDLRPNTNSSNLQALELLKAGISSGGSLSSLISMPLSDSNSIFYSSVLPPQELKPKFNFSLHGLENGYASVDEPVQDTSARLFLPYEELKPVSTAPDQYDQQNKGQGESTGYWNGMLGGGSW